MIQLLDAHTTDAKAHCLLNMFSWLNEKSCSTLYRRGWKQWIKVKLETPRQKQAYFLKNKSSSVLWSAAVCVCNKCSQKVSFVCRKTSRDESWHDISQVILKRRWCMNKNRSTLQKGTDYNNEIIMALNRKYTKTKSLQPCKQLWGRALS